MGTDATRTKNIKHTSGKMIPYITTLFPAGGGFNLSMEIVVTCRSMAAFIAGLAEGRDGHAVGAEMVGTIPHIAQELLDKGGTDFLYKIFAHTSRNEQKVELCFDVAYQGNYGELLMALVWVIRENWQSFFEAKIILVTKQSATQKSLASSALAG